MLPLFHRIDSIEPVVSYIAEKLKGPLAQGKHVVWLVPGGSAISVAVAVGKKLQDVPLDRLTVTLTDERYGPVGHKDSNWKQLLDAGFDLPGARMIPVLASHDLETTTADFNRLLLTMIGIADTVIGFFGMGPDGHVAGILPHSSAVNSSDFVASYDAPPYQRITMTTVPMLALTEAIIYATGEPKRTALENLKKELPVTDQPAQALKLAHAFTVFTDQRI